MVNLYNIDDVVFEGVLFIIVGVYNIVRWLVVIVIDDMVCGR